MKQFIKSKQLKIILIALVIIAGIVMIAVKGFNFDLKYQDTQRVELYLKTEFNISDIRQITDEVFGNQKVMIQKVEVFEDSVSITTTSISDEQKSNLITKIRKRFYELYALRNCLPGSKKDLYHYETPYAIHDPGLRTEFIKIIKLFFVSKPKRLTLRCLQLKDIGLRRGICCLITKMCR